jgi:hypothetical protein
MAELPVRGLTTVGPQVRSRGVLSLVGGGQVTAWAWWDGHIVCLLFFLVCLHLSAFVCVLSTWAALSGCMVLGGYVPLEVVRQGEVATDLTFFLLFLTDFLALLNTSPELPPVHL